MKTLLFCSLTLILAFTGCMKDDDLANPNKSISAIKSDQPEDTAPDAPGVDDGYCQAIHSDHYLLGKGSWEKPDDPNDDRRGSHYVLYASGEAFLDGEAGRSKLSLQYDPE